MQLNLIPQYSKNLSSSSLKLELMAVQRRAMSSETNREQRGTQAHKHGKRKHRTVRGKGWKVSPPLLAPLSSFLSNPTEAAMKSAPLLLASCLGYKTMVESSRENNGRAGALIHPSAYMLGDLGLTPITSHEGGGGGEGGGGVWMQAKEMAIVSLCIASLASFLSVKPPLSPAQLPTVIIWPFTPLPLYLWCSLTFCLCPNLIFSPPNSVPSLAPRLLLSIFFSKLC